MPVLICAGPRHCEAHRMAIAIMGAVDKLRGRWFGSPLNLGRGIRTGTMTKKMEMIKNTRVTMEKRVIIVIYALCWRTAVLT